MEIEIENGMRANTSSKKQYGDLSFTVLICSLYHTELRIKSKYCSLWIIYDLELNRMETTRNLMSSMVIL